MNLAGQISGQTGGGCPPADELSQFLSGDLPDDRLNSVAAHVAGCPSCERAANGDPAARKMRLPANAYLEHLAREPECQRMVDAVVSQRFGRSSAHGLDLGMAISSVAAEGSTAAREDATADGVGELSLTHTYAASFPATIGRYQVQSLLGQGKFGKVFLARDPELMRDVAIKVPQFPDDATAERCEAFVREARSAAQVHHPAIVTIYDVGLDADGTIFLAMEYVKGQTLRAIASEKRLSHDEASKVVEDVARAVHYAHKLGLVHRDLKPANILLDAENQPKIADFGLALAEDQQRGREGEFAGSPAYMAPEQVRREAHRLDGRSDVWSLGVMLYELLTGRRPFSGDRAQLLDEILNREPRPPRQIDDTIAPRLEQICLTCLHKDIGRRYPTARDLADDLGRLRAQQRGIRGVLGRHRAAAASVALLLVFAAALSMSSMRRQISPSGIPQQQPIVAGATITPSVKPDADLAALAPLKWQTLLQRKPESLFTADPRGNWHFDADRSEIQIDSRTPLLFALGDSNVKSFKLQVGLSRNAKFGSAGIFFGFQPGKPVGDHRIWKCQVIWSRFERDETLSVEREELTLDERRDGRLSMSSNGRGNVEVGVAVPRDATLELVVKGGRVSDIRWEGQPLKDLCDLHSAKGDVPDTTGKFGIINRRGTVTFGNARFMKLTGEK